ncbi:MAG: thioredoxin family protein [Saprospiraceae bacterium]|nr:thioredoxin family protein [Saprospiraceae bacterium]
MSIKNLFSIIFCLLALQVGFGQGINFETGNWASILKKAKAENKLIYVDAYTTWCGPCKMMKKNIFPDKTVGDYYNQHFVNAQIDMEKGEGLKIAKDYDIRAYPSHLFVNGDGELVHKGLGYMDVNEFVELGKQANDPDHQYATLKKRFDAGDRDPVLMTNYLDLLMQMGDEEGDRVAAEYFKNQKDLTTPQNLKYLSAFAINPSSPNHHLVLENKDALVKARGSDFLNELAYYYTMMSIKKGLNQDEAIREISKIYPEKSGILSFYTKIYFSRKNKDNQAYTNALLEYLTPENIEQFSSNELNSYAWYIYENVEGLSNIRQALGWALTSVDKDSNYANNDTLAWLYFKLGDIENAKATAKIAIELGKAAGEDTSSTEELLKK